MACDRCISTQRITIVIGEPVECKCDYCGNRFVVGKPSQCVTCLYYWQVKTDDGYRFMCNNDDADGMVNCNGYFKEEELTFEF